MWFWARLWLLTTLPSSNGSSHAQQGDESAQMRDAYEYYRNELMQVRMIGVCGVSIEKSTKQSIQKVHLKKNIKVHLEQTLKDPLQVHDNVH